MIGCLRVPQKHVHHSDFAKYYTIKIIYYFKNVPQTIAPIYRNNYNDFRSFYVISTLGRSYALVSANVWMLALLCGSVGDDSLA